MAPVVKSFKTVAAVNMQKQREDGREQKRGREKKGEKLHQPEQIQAEQSEETGGKGRKFAFFHIQSPFIKFIQVQCYFMNRLPRYAKFKFDRYVNTLTSTCIPYRGVLLYRCEVDHKQTYPFV